MSDTPGNSGDQPVPIEPSSSEPVTQVGGGAATPPPWAPQPQGWAPPVAPPPPPAVDVSQPWAPQPQPAPQGFGGPVDQGWPPQQVPMPGPQFQPAPRASGSGGHGMLFGIISLLLVIALVAVGAFSYMTISSTNKTLDDTKASLATEQAAHKAADAQVTAMNECVTAMKADEAALTGLNSDVAAIEAATAAYESELKKAVDDFYQGSLAMNHATTQAEYSASIVILNRAVSEMNQAATLKATMDLATNKYSQDLATAKAQSAKTATQCAAAASPAPASPGKSPSPSPKK